MARIRTVKPEFFQDKRLAAVSESTQLMYAGLWTMCDDYGICLASPCEIKTRLYLYRDTVDEAEISRRLQSLVRLRRLYIFEVRGEQYAFLPTFLAHQYIPKPSIKPTIDFRKMRVLIPDFAIPKTYTKGREFIAHFLQKVDILPPDAATPSLFDNSNPDSGFTGCRIPPTDLFTLLDQESIETEFSKHSMTPPVLLHDSSMTPPRPLLLDRDRDRDREKDMDKDRDKDREIVCGEKNEKQVEEEKKPLKASPVTQAECRAYFQTRTKDHWAPDFATLQADEFFKHYESVGWKTSFGQPYEKWEPKADTWINRNQTRLKEVAAKQVKDTPPPTPVATMETVGREVNKLYQLFLISPLSRERIESKHYKYLKELDLLQISEAEQADIIERACKIRADELFGTNQRSCIFMGELYKQGAIEDERLRDDSKHFYKITKGLSVMITFQRMKAMGKTSIDVIKNEAATC